MNLRRAVRGLIISALLSALVYAVLAALTDAREVGDALRDFPPAALLGMVALTLGCYFMRAVRWRYLMSVMEHPMTFRDSVYLQFSGMTMTVTPGKVGEVLKAFIAREIAGLPMARGIALVFSERLTDLVAVTALSVGGVRAVAQGGPALATAAVVLAVGIAVLQSRKFNDVALSVLKKQSWMQAHAESAGSVSETIRTTLTVKPLIASTTMSAVAWSMEGLAFALCVRALGFDGLTVAASVAVYAISTIIGALTFLPGGIGLTEASMAGLLVAAGMHAADASAATLLIRLVTLWFGVGLGWVVFVTRPKMLRTLMLGADGNGAEESPAP